MRQRIEPPNSWTLMSRKRKKKYMEGFVGLYGDSQHAKEGNVQTESTDTDRKDRARNIHEMAMEMLPEGV